jgi:type IV secretory pathway TrbD component
MKGRNVAAVGLVILLGLIVGALGLVASDLYTVGVLILFIGGVGAAVLAGDYVIRRVRGRPPPA